MQTNTYLKNANINVTTKNITNTNVACKYKCNKNKIITNANVCYKHKCKWYKQMSKKILLCLRTQMNKKTRMYSQTQML